MNIYVLIGAYFLAGFFVGRIYEYKIQQAILNDAIKQIRHLNQRLIDLIEKLRR